MSEVLHFVESYSSYAFRPGILPRVLQQCWDLLVDIVQHYLRPSNYTVPVSEPETGAQQCSSFLKGAVSLFAVCNHLTTSTICLMSTFIQFLTTLEIAASRGAGSGCGADTRAGRQADKKAGEQAQKKRKQTRASHHHAAGSESCIQHQYQTGRTRGVGQPHAG